MNGGLLPIILLFTTIGLMLSLASARGAWFGLIGLVAGAALMALVPLPEGLTTPVLAGVGFSMIGTAALVFLPRLLPDRWAIAAAVNAGLWAGALASLSGRQAGLAASVPLTLLFVPGRLITSRGLAIVLKVASSWMIAIATLSIFVSLTPTPGYQPDHME